MSKGTIRVNNRKERGQLATLDGPSALDVSMPPASRSYAHPSSIMREPVPTVSLTSCR
jgi:hypothetical protein